MLAQKMALSYGSRIVVQFFQILTTIIIARIVGPSVLGTVAYGLAFGSLFKMIAELGVGTAHMKLLSEGRDAKACLGTYARIKVSLIGTYFVFAMGAFFVQKYLFKYKFESREFQYVIIVSIFILTIEYFWTIPKVTFAAYTEQAKQDIPNLIYQVLYQILRLTVVLLGYRALAMAFSNLTAVVIVTFLYFYLFKNYQIGKFDRQLAKLYFSMSVPIVIMMLAQSLVYQSDIVLLQFLTNSEQVGYYTAGFRIGGYVKLIGQSVGILFFPIFSKAISENNLGLINEKIGKFERFSVSFILPLVLVTSIGSDFIIKLLLGKKYLPSIPILSIINLTMFIYVLFIPYGNILSGKGLFKLLAKIYSFQLFSFVGIAYFLVAPKMLNLGSVGIACSLLLANIILGAMFFYFAKANFRELKLFPSGSKFLYGCIAGLSGYLIYIYFVHSMLGKFILLALFVILYWGIAYLFSIINKDDWKMVFDVLNLKKMNKYIKSEITLKNKSTDKK
ncbi:MAG: oligosaccharide flippase family protein [Thermodesulfovibrionales bacterium]|nr:oligosaccharide flippase family protein [Thermodesulfovibrionales bacterium]